MTIHIRNPVVKVKKKETTVGAAKAATPAVSKAAIIALTVALATTPLAEARTSVYPVREDVTSQKKFIDSFGDHSFPVDLLAHVVFMSPDGPAELENIDKRPLAAVIETAKGRELCWLEKVGKEHRLRVFEKGEMLPKGARILMLV